MFDKYVCPECGGSGLYFLIPNSNNSEDIERCSYCYGTGFASEEDTEEHFYRYEDI